jgi:hypothetical protein
MQQGSLIRSGRKRAPGSSARRVPKGFGRVLDERRAQTRMESVFDVVVQELKNIRFPFGDAKVEQTVPII